MTRKKGFARGLAAATGSILGVIALLALAAPAVAHHHGESGFEDDPAGTIASFDSQSGKLVIDLADGGSIGGLVTRLTWIDSDDSCDRVRHDDRSHRPLHGECRRLHDFGPGDDNGRRDSTADLVAGAVVDDAVLVLKDGHAYYAKVELD